MASHSRASNAVLRAVDCGVDVIYHCEFADSQALDRLEAVRDRVFVGPAIGLIHNTLHEAEPWGITGPAPPRTWHWTWAWNAAWKTRSAPTSRCESAASAS